MVGLATLILIGLLWIAIISWSVWVIGRIFRKAWYFPNRSICCSVHKRLPGWWNSAIKHLTKEPEGISTLGFFCTILWPLIIALNILFLAQVLETLILGGKRITIPWIGSYDVLTLATAALFVFVQIVFGILHKSSKSRSGKVLFLLLISITVIFEMFLAVWRAWLLVGGKEMISPTILDKAMLIGGPILGGFLGFVVPIAEVVSGGVSYFQFIEPMVKGFMNWLLGGILTMGCFIAYILFGFHSTNPCEWESLPPEISDLKSKSEKLRKKTEKLKEKTEAQNLKINDLEKESKEITPFREIKQDLNNKNESIEKMRAESANWFREKGNIIKNLKNLKDLENVIMNLNKEKDWNINKIDKIRREALITDGLIRKSRRTSLKIQKDISKQKRHMGEFKNKLESLKNKSLDLENRANSTNMSTHIQDINITLESIKTLLQGIEKDLQNIEEGLGAIESQLLSSTEEQKLVTEEQKLVLVNDYIEIEKELDSLQKNFNADFKKLIKEGKNKRVELMVNLRSLELLLPWYWARWLSIYLKRRREINKPSLIFLILLLLSSGCVFKEEKSKFVIVLVDETGSFGLPRENIMFWEEVKPYIKKVVEYLNGGDTFALIGIDDHGFDTDDIRISEQTLNPSLLIAVRQKRKISEEVKTLTRRTHRKQISDILGALYHSAYLFDKKSGVQRVLIIFSDMIQTPRFPTPEEAKELKFPQDTQGYCFYVNASGRSEWNRITRTWLSIFDNAGLNITEREFFQRGEDINTRLNKIFSK